MPRLVNAGADLAAMVVAVLDDLGETEAQRRVEIPAIAVLDDVGRRGPASPSISAIHAAPFAVIAARRSASVTSCVLVHRRGHVAEERQVPGIGRHEVAERRDDRAVRARRFRHELFAGQDAAGIDEALGRPDVMGERVIQE